MRWFLGGGGGSSSTSNVSNDRPDKNREEAAAGDETANAHDDFNRSQSPPPTHHHHPPPPPTSVVSSTTPPRSVSDLTRPQRPIDPVFRSGVEYATYPKVSSQQQQYPGGPAQQQYQTNNNIHVFVPRAAAATTTTTTTDPHEGEESSASHNNDEEGPDYRSSSGSGSDETSKDEDTSSSDHDGDVDGDVVVNDDSSGQYSVVEDDNSEDSENNNNNNNNYDEETETNDTDDEQFDHDNEAAMYAADEETEVGENADDDYQPNFGDNTAKIHQEEEGKEEAMVGTDPVEGVLNQSLISEDASIDVQTTTTPKSSRFVFLSDQRGLPTDLKRLQERTIKRRREIRQRMHQLDCQAAQLTALAANEQMDMQLALHDGFDRMVHRPLVSSFERITIDRDSSSNPMIVRSLERRVDEMDCSMTKHMHETMCDTKTEQLDSIYNTVQHELTTELRIENAKFDKVEGGIVRRYEQVAGVMARDLHGESSRRRGEMELLQRKIEGKAKVEATERLQQKLLLIQQLRDQLKKERMERKLADQRIRTEINESKIKIERAMLAAFETEP